MVGAPVKFQKEFLQNTSVMHYRCGSFPAVYQNAVYHKKENLNLWRELAIVDKTGGKWFIDILSSLSL